jgi:hypothetical protein
MINLYPHLSGNGYKYQLPISGSNDGMRIYSIVRAEYLLHRQMFVIP